MRTVKIGLIILGTAFVLLFAFAYIFKIETDYYCCESPTYRWKFAIYCGECSTESPCNFEKIEGTGMLEYFGLKKIPCKN